MSDEVAFSVVGGRVEQLTEVSLEDIGFRERKHLQRWIEDYPEIVGPDLLVVTTEFDRWALGTERIKDRLDVLFLNSTGALVVAELKRGEAPDTVDLQALKYAAYCSQLTVEDIVGDHARYHHLEVHDSREAVFEHALSLESGGVRPVKVRLVAESFRPSVTSMVLWLRDYDLDIGCIQISARRLHDGNAIITSRQLLPLPAAEDYLVKRRRREKDEERREVSERRTNVVTELLTAGAIEPGSGLSLKLDNFTREEQSLIKPNLQKDPLTGRAEWTGISLLKALRWQLDNEYYSATGLVKKILQEYGPRTKPVPGPQYWTVPDGRTLVEVADELTESQETDNLEAFPLGEVIE